MNIKIISIFPEIYESFIKSSLIAKAQDKGILKFDLINPRDFCEDKHRQVDDIPYGGGVGMVIKAKPMIDALESVVEEIESYGIESSQPSFDKGGLKAMQFSEETLKQRGLVSNGFYLPYNPELKERAGYMRKNPTEAEKIMRKEILHECGITVLRQKPIDNYIVDFYIPKIKLAIEIDGEIHDLDGSKEYDEERTKILENDYGLKVIRFSNNDVVNNLDEVKKQLETIFKLDYSINSGIKDNTFSPLYQRGAGGDSNKSFIIIYCSPSKIIFNQNHAEEFSKYENIIFISGRYEGIDKRFEDYIDKKYPGKLKKISIGQFITMGGESPSMVMIEAISRLIPGVIKEEESHINESYSTAEDMKNIEHPYYTRPEEVYGMKVPDVLISGHHKNIEKRKEDNSGLMSE